jgi:hypothetical protein
MSNKSNPFRRHAAITPHDTAYLPVGTCAIYCLAPGNCIVQDLDGVSITYAMVAGQILPGEARRVMAASTGTYVAWIV